ncbi:hypothetical protein C3766_10755 [Heyndrickxia coagulans]|nr:hypothetical protein C3766_10755 [Heyndrickxia coagulans]
MSQSLSAPGSGRVRKVTFLQQSRLALYPTGYTVERALAVFKPAHYERGPCCFRPAHCGKGTMPFLNRLHCG